MAAILEEAKSIRVRQICDFIRQFAEDNEVLKWLYDAEFGRTHAKEVPEYVQTTLLAADPRQDYVQIEAKKFAMEMAVHVNNRMIPYPDVQAVIDRAGTYDSTNGKVTIDLAELDCIADGKPGKHMAKLIAEAAKKNLDLGVVQRIQSMQEERMIEVLDFLETVSRSKPVEYAKQALAWLRDMDDVRQEILSEEVRDVLRESDPEFKVLSGNELAPHDDAQEIINITVGPHKTSGLAVFTPKSLTKYQNHGKGSGREE